MLGDEMTRTVLAARAIRLHTHRYGRCQERRQELRKQNDDRERNETPAKAPHVTMLVHPYDAIHPGKLVRPPRSSAGWISHHRVELAGPRLARHPIAIHERQPR